METRLRLVFVLRGLPVPEAQHPVQDERRRRVEQVLRDVGRYTGLVDRGWRIYRFTKYEVYGEPDEIAAKIRRALGAR